jgi:hypothetical protein
MNASHGVHTVMEADANARARRAALVVEMDAIHAINSLYWKRGEAATLEQRTAYRQRLDRLDEIRVELDLLHEASASSSEGRQHPLQVHPILDQSSGD